MIEQIYSTYLHLCVMKTIITMRMMKMMSSLTSCRHHKSVARILDVLQQSLPTLPSPTAILGTDNFNASPQARMSCIKGPQRNTLRQFEKSTGGVLSYSLVLPTHHCE